MVDCKWAAGAFQQRGGKAGRHLTTRVRFIPACVAADLTRHLPAHSRRALACRGSGLRPRCPATPVQGGRARARGEARLGLRELPRDLAPLRHVEGRVRLQLAPQLVGAQQQRLALVVEAADLRKQGRHTERMGFGR